MADAALDYVFATFETKAAALNAVRDVNRKGGRVRGGHTLRITFRPFKGHARKGPMPQGQGHAPAMYHQQQQHHQHGGKPRAPYHHEHDGAGGGSSARRGGYGGLQHNAGRGRSRSPAPSRRGDSSSARPHSRRYSRSASAEEDRSGRRVRACVHA